MRSLDSPVLEKAPNSPQPVGPSISTASRSVTPRNRTRIGSVTVRAPQQILEFGHESRW
jgi:hypothetical protein